MKIDFSGQVALVTGGTRGIGQQIADDLFDLGANLILTGTDSKQSEELNRSLPAEKRKRIKFIAADFRDSENIKKFKMTKKDVQIERAKQSLIPKETILTYRKDYSKKYGEII